MIRWSQYDEDNYRLPEGMERVGYDADTQTYSYRDSDGSYWHGEPGARFGKLHRVDQDPEHTGLLNYPQTATNERLADGHQIHNEPQDLERQESERRRSDWAQFAPFLLLIGLVLLLMFHLMS